MLKSLILIISITYSSFTFANLSQYLVIPSIKKEIVNYVVKNRSAEESYSAIKDISLSAVHFVQSEGIESSERLEELISIVSRRLETDAVYLSRKDIVEAIIKAINS